MIFLQYVIEFFYYWFVIHEDFTKDYTEYCILKTIQMLGDHDYDNSKRSLEDFLYQNKSKEKGVSVIIENFDDEPQVQPQFQRI